MVPVKDDGHIHVIGGGLAGSEAAWQIARLGGRAVVHEMRPGRTTPAHQTARLAELVCSNSLRSDDAEFNAVGLLHEEMRRCGSLIMEAADRNRVPAGGALAVDREGFSAFVEDRLQSDAAITIRREEVAGPPPADWHSVILAPGPLCSPALAEAIGQLGGSEMLAFFDAIAPVIYKDSIDFSQAWFQSRYDKGGGADYINCPLSRPQYEGFVRALLGAPKTEFRDWERQTPYFEGCLPIEVMAERGAETLAFGPMKPVGLTNPHDPTNKPAAIVQLRQDNALGTLYNMVGFQTKLTHQGQKEVFRAIPGLERAEFARLGGVHRNSFINSPRLLDGALRLKAQPRLRFAGQITGCEGYVESAAVGLLAGRFAHSERFNQFQPFSPPPATSALGALLSHLTAGAEPGTFQPMNINFGLFPPISAEKPAKGESRKKARRQAMSRRALADLKTWLTPQAIP